MCVEGGPLHFQVFSKQLDLSLDINDHEFSKALTYDFLPVQMQHIWKEQENTSKGSLQNSAADQPESQSEFQSQLILLRSLALHKSFDFSELCCQLSSTISKSTIFIYIYTRTQGEIKHPASKKQKCSGHYVCCWDGAWNPGGLLKGSCYLYTCSRDGSFAQLVECLPRMHIAWDSISSTA